MIGDTGGVFGMRRQPGFDGVAAFRRQLAVDIGVKLILDIEITVDHGGIPTAFHSLLLII